MKVFVLFKDGFEELEALSVVDVMFRSHVDVVMVGMDKNEVTSSHGICVKMNQVYDESLFDGDVLVIPGGMPGAASLRDDERVIQLVKDYNQKKKGIAAICAGPIVLEKAGIMEGKHYTCYPGFEKEISGIYHDTLTYRDGNIISARGPAAALQFAYDILEYLGIDSSEVARGMQYSYLKM